MTANVIQRVRELAASRLADAESRYIELAHLLANGGDADPEDVLHILADTDRSDDDLQRDIASIEGLAAARKQLEALPDVLRRIAVAEQQQRELSAELTAVHKRIADQQKVLADQLNAEMAAKARLEEIERQITVGAFDLPSQAARRAQAGRVIAQNGMAASNLRTELEQARRKAQALTETLDRLKAGRQPNPNDINAAASDLASTERRIAMIERELRPVEQAIAQANAVFAELAGGAA